MEQGEEPKATVMESCALYLEEPKMEPTSPHVSACAISLHGSWFATGGDDGKVCVIDVATREVVYSALLENHVRSAVFSIAWHSDGNRFVALCCDGILTEFCRSRGSWSHNQVYHNGDENIRGCAISANGLVAIGYFDKYVVILDSNSNYSVKQTIQGLADSAYCVAFSSNGSVLAIGCGTGSLITFGSARGTQYIYGFNQSTGLYNLLSECQHHISDIYSLSFSPSDSHLIVGCRDNSASLWSIPSNLSTWPKTPLFVLEGHSGSVKSTCFSDDGSHVITASEDKTVRIWRVSDGEHVGTLDTESAVLSASVHSGRLFTGLSSGSLHSRPYPPYDNSPTTTPAFISTHVHLANAQRDVNEIQLKLSSIDPSIRQSSKRATALRREIALLQRRIAAYNAELASLESPSMKEILRNIDSLEKDLAIAKKNVATCKKIIGHVSDCSFSGYFSSLPRGVCFDQWLFDSGMGHTIGKWKDLNAQKLFHMNINDLTDYGFSYQDACDIHIRACATAHMQTVGDLPGVFSWDATQVSTWLKSRGSTYASLVSLGWTGPSLLALSTARIRSASDMAIGGEEARVLKERIVAMVKNDEQLPKWMRMWNGALSVADYGEIKGEAKGFFSSFFAF